MNKLNELKHSVNQSFSNSITKPKENPKDEAIRVCLAAQGRDSVGSFQLAVGSLIWKLQAGNCKLTRSPVAQFG